MGAPRARRKADIDIVSNEATPKSSQDRRPQRWEKPNWKCDPALERKSGQAYLTMSSAAATRYAPLVGGMEPVSLGIVGTAWHLQKILPIVKDLGLFVPAVSIPASWPWGQRHRWSLIRAQDRERRLIAHKGLAHDAKDAMCLKHRKRVWATPPSRERLSHTPTYTVPPASTRRSQLLVVHAFFPHAWSMRMVPIYARSGLTILMLHTAFLSALCSLSPYCASPRPVLWHDETDVLVMHRPPQVSCPHMRTCVHVCTCRY